MRFKEVAFWGGADAPRTRRVCGEVWGGFPEERKGRLLTCGLIWIFALMGGRI
jgi:hypothetical protein